MSLDPMPVELPATPARGRLSSRMVGQLSAGEQFLVWALRQRLHDGGPGSPVLVHGFRLAFGLCALEPAMAAFEGCFAVMAARPRAGGIALCPLRCACLTADEEAVFSLVAAAQLGRPGEGGLDLVEASARPELRTHVATLAGFLARAGLVLADARPRGAGRLH